MDINGDHIPDLILNPSFGAPSVRLGNGDGTFQADLSLAPNLNTSGFLSGQSSVAIADFNRDGKPDLAAPGQGGITAFLNLSEAPPPLTVVQGASFTPGPLAPGSIAAAFGTKMVPQAVTAETPSSTSLAGITVTVQDSAGIGRLATLFFVSPNQINFRVPPATSPGPATVTVSGASSGAPLSVQTQIAPVVPALFTIPGSTQFPNEAAAYLIRVAPDGSQSVGSILNTQFGSGFLVPIDLTLPGQVFLVLFGTGFDLADSGSTVATVQGIPVPVTYAGPQLSTPGLDQVNVLLPGSLTGTGQAVLSVSIKGMASNEVTVFIR